jgi:hypothetical protein
MVRGSVLAIWVGAMLACGPAMAQAWGDPFEGTWIWDPSRYVPAPNMPTDVRMVRETMFVAHDDGHRFAARIEKVFSNGAWVINVEDFAEDGADHTAGPGPDALKVRITKLPDGGRRVVSAHWGGASDSLCHVSAGGLTLSCEGTYTAPDGSKGRYACMYHRDRYTIPVAELAPGRLYA